ncbi:MAG: hypothetical protein V1825_04450 [Candidatus Falkowbacteria bacterium]
MTGTFNATAWLFETLIFAGELTLEAFLNPSHYADLPSSAYSSVPNAKSCAKKPKKKQFKEMTIRHSLWRLQKQGFVRKEGRICILTDKGKKLADYILKRKRAINKDWDNKYRVVIFDIPEKQASKRDWLRQELYLLNYKKLQESVFISKHPLIPDLIKEIKRRKIGNFVNYLLVDKVYKNIQ